VRAVVQRVSRAEVTVEGSSVGRIGAGLLVLLGISPADGDAEVEWIVDKLAGLRIFEDAGGKMNLSAGETGAGFLVVSQFTLYGDARRGRRPSFVKAADGPEAAAVYERVVAGLRARGFSTETGRFGAHMDVELVGDGPVTILLDSEKTF
jgi:D-tyrosyl-tRNA(Tyr) deacylase